MFTYSTTVKSLWSLSVKTFESCVVEPDSHYFNFRLFPKLSYSSTYPKTSKLNLIDCIFLLALNVFSKVYFVLRIYHDFISITKQFWFQHGSTRIHARFASCPKQRQRSPYRRERYLKNHHHRWQFFLCSSGRTKRLWCGEWNHRKLFLYERDEDKNWRRYFFGGCSRWRWRTRRI